MGLFHLFSRKDGVLGTRGFVRFKCEYFDGQWNGGFWVVLDLRACALWSFAGVFT